MKLDTSNETSVASNLEVMSELPTVRNPNQSFYSDLVKAIVPYCGNEYPENDFGEASRFLNYRLELDLSEIEVRILGILFTGLAQAHRFAGSLHIPGKLGENSSVHSCHTAILLNEFYRRAGLLGSGLTESLNKIRKEETLAILLHDMGEVFGEFNSAEQRARDKTLVEDGDTEREIFSWLLKLAVMTMTKPQPAAHEFYQTLQTVRNETARRGGLSKSVILDLICNQYKIDYKHEIYDKFMRAYDLIESKKSATGPDVHAFSGALCKQVEHMQGTRQLIRFCKKGQNYKELKEFSPSSSRYTAALPAPKPEDERVISFDLVDSYSFKSSIVYCEGGLASLFRHADNPVQYKLAKEVRTGTYQTVREFLNCGAPVIDLSISTVNPSVVEQITRFNKINSNDPNVISDHIRRLEQLHRDKIEELLARSDQLAIDHDFTKSFPEVVRTEQLAKRYALAIEKDFTPGFIKEGTHMEKPQILGLMSTNPIL